jgi:hypothetical protein
MFRLARLSVAAAAAAVFLVPVAVSAAEVSGTYLESRTCQVYTGPCFANAEIGITGKDAIMAWSIDTGTHQGIDVSGLNVVMVVSGTDTLAFRGIADARQIKSVVLVDERANDAQRKALVDFAQQRTGAAGKSVVRVDAAPIEMSLDLGQLSGKLTAGREVKLTTRKARETDCICSNEVAYYPPLVDLEYFAAGVTVDGAYSGRGLGTQWSMPNSRSAYMATFSY